MIHNSAPQRVLKISELTRLIASQLVLVSRKSAVNLACACRSLEEPVLSILWEPQSLLFILLKVLPEENWDLRYQTFDKSVFRIIGDPLPGDWNRVWRYASWMHQVCVEDWMILEGETLKKLYLNSPPGRWFPSLQDLSWHITEFNLPYAYRFFSPHLKRIRIYASWSWDENALPLNALPALPSTITVLPTSRLERMSVGDNYHITPPWAHFKDSFSSVILRCGPSFTEYNAPIPLSNAALHHLIHLPHLHTWHIHGPPPTYTTSSLPLVFPPLRKLTLGEGAARGWLPLLRRLEDGASTTQGVTPLSKAKESLKVLNVDDMFGVDIDPSFVSTIQCFRNLVDLNIDDHCPSQDDRDGCIFKLSDDNITELAMTLTQLKLLHLGRTCSKNTCLTTIACLLPISVHCSKLEKLMIHFNTTNIVDDSRNILEDPRFQQLRSRPKCLLKSLTVYRTPLEIDDSDLETVAKGMIDIFPSLRGCDGYGLNWCGLSREIAGPQEDSDECPL